MLEKQTNHWRWIVLTSLLAILVIYIYRTYYYWHYVNDDAYITFRYSRFLAMGRGPYFNVGEHVEGYTNFSLMLIMALVIRIMGSDVAPAVSKIIGATSGSLSIIMAFAMCGYHLRKSAGFNLTADVWGLGAAGIVAVNPAFALNSVSGLETTLFAFLLILSVFLASIEIDLKKWLGSGLAFGAAVLTRPEGILLFAVFCLAQAIVAIPGMRKKGGKLSDILANDPTLKILITNGLIVTVCFISQEIFRLICYDGEWLPNTYYAKAEGFWKISSSAYISQGILPSFFGVVGIALSFSGFLLKRKTITPYIPLGAIAAAGVFLPYITGPDWMRGWRLLMPFLPLAASFIVIGWALLFSRLLRVYSWVGPALMIACIPLLWLKQDIQRKDFYNYIYIRAIGYKTGHIALANWLQNKAAKPGDSIALMDIGLVGYMCIDQRIIDLTGLTDRFIAKRNGIFLKKIYDPKYILDQHPDYIILTFTSEGISYEPFPPGIRFKPWIRMEKMIYLDPEFKKDYINYQSSELSSNHWLTALSRELGAEKIFEHAYPGVYYLMAVFHHTSG